VVHTRGDDTAENPCQQRNGEEKPVTWAGTTTTVTLASAPMAMPTPAAEGPKTTRNDHDSYGNTNTHHPHGDDDDQHSTHPHAYEPLLVGWIMGADWTMRGGRKWGEWRPPPCLRAPAYRVVCRCRGEGGRDETARGRQGDKTARGRA
jgi:hypothetical protein